MIPRNAQRILDARLRGERPADPVVVSFVGEIPWGNPQVFAEPGRDYDWRFLKGLPVYVVVKAGQDVRSALAEIYDLAQLYPTFIDFERKGAASVVEGKPLKFWHMRRGGAAWKGLFA